MSYPIRILVACLILFAGLSCKSTEQDSDQRILKIQKTACYRECPEYQAVIFEDGTVRFTGRNHVPLTGEHDIQLSKEEVKTINSLLKAMQDEGIRDSYVDDRIADLPTVFITVFDKNNTRTIEYNYAPPQELKELSSKVEAILFNHLD